MSTKSTPTLRRIKRRQLLTALPSSSCPLLRSAVQPPTPIPGSRPQNATSTRDGDTESIHSEEVEPSTSFYFCFGGVETLEETFPSILRLIDSLSRVYHGNDPDAFCALASIFATVVADIASCIAATELEDPTGEQFTLAKSIFHLLLNTFVSITKKVGDHKFHRGHHRHLEMRKAFEYAQLVHENLILLYQSGLRRSPTKRSFPLYPARVQCQSEDRRKNDGEKGSTRPALNRRSSLSCLPTRPSEGPGLDIYNQRHTTLFFGGVRIPSTFSYVKDGHEVFDVNKNNQVQAVPVPFLISIITPDESSANLDLIQAILACFRLFITPTEFFQELKERFELKPPAVPDDASQWDTKISNIRANVLAVIYSWLDQHWQVDSDTVVLGRIRAFVEEQSGDECHGRTLLAKVAARKGCSEEDIFNERKRHIASTSPARTPPPDCTQFIFPQRFHASSNGLLQLDTDGGREELCRHLTMKMSRLYRQLDPNKIIKFWYKEGESCRNYDKFKDEPGVEELAAISCYGEQLTLWIISSILEINNPKRRAERLSFWVDVASRCMAHCDYATAHNIYASLSFSAVIRLKKTILAIPYAPKVQYKKLEIFFQDERMFRATFDDLRLSLPSSTAPLVRDIIYARKWFETSQDSSSPSNFAYKRKIISLDECRMLQQATRVLNKALMEYKFHQNKDLSQWLDDRLKDFCTIDTRNIYNKLHQMSYEREPTQANLTQFTNPWKYSFKPKNALKGKFARLGSNSKVTAV